MRWVRAGLALVVVAVAGAAGAAVSYGAFNSLTGAGASSLQAGTVVLSDNDVGAAVIQLADGDAGQSTSGCIRIRYDGTIGAGVRIHGTATGALAPYLTLTIVRGTDAAPAFNSCASFAPDAADHIGAGAGVVWTGAMSALPATWTTGIVDPSASAPETWTTGEERSYKVVVTVTSAPAGQGRSASVGLSFEARNQ